MKNQNSLNITLSDFKFLKEETVFLQEYVWSLYNLFTRPLADLIRNFCTVMRTHPSIRVRYVVVVGRERVSETFSLVTDTGSPFLTIDISQSIKFYENQGEPVYLDSSKITDLFDKFMTDNGTVSFKTSNNMVHVDIHTISYRLRSLILDLSEFDANGTTEIDTDGFSLNLKKRIDGADTYVNLKFYKTNIKGKTP
jgi:hypothetical protein